MISGIQKLSLVDYKGHPAFVIFMGNCNLRCPYCHNSSIVKAEENYDKECVLSLIQKRKNFIDAVVVTGGEPTLHKSFLLSLLEDLQKIGLLVKLDTNGTHPTVLKEIIDRNLVSYIAMDIKNTFSKYSPTVGIPHLNTEKIQESIMLLETSSIPYEFRMTINQKMHTFEDIKEVYTYVKNKDTFYIQPYRFNENQLEKENFGEFSEAELAEINDLVYNTVRN